MVGHASGIKWIDRPLPSEFASQPIYKLEDNQPSQIIFKKKLQTLPLILENVYTPMCTFSAYIYGGNVIINLKENTKFRHQVTIQNKMESRWLHFNCY